jgi:hypothetical protein
VRAFLEANELIFLDRIQAQNCTPKELLEVIDFIEHVFSIKNWQREIKKNKTMLDDVFKKITPKSEVKKDPTNEALILD